MASGEFRVVTDAEIDSQDLDRFMRGYFSTEKCDYLRDYGAWHYRGRGNRLIVLNSEGAIVGHRGTMPVEVKLGNRTVSAIWLMDLYVAPEWRGRGIKRLTDEVVYEMAELAIGFPNAFVVPIHRKHGWGVRDDLRLMMLPLRPNEILGGRSVEGIKGWGVNMLSKAALPLVSLYKRRLAVYKSVSAWRMKETDAAVLTEIFQQGHSDWISTNRGVDYIADRYLTSPFRSQYAFFVGGNGEAPSLAVILRTFDRGGIKIARILDVFGDFTNRQVLSDLMKTAVRYAMQEGAAQVTALASNPFLVKSLRKRGFLLSQPVFFHWYSQDQSLMQTMARRRCHWVYADSDNDSVG